MWLSRTEWRRHCRELAKAECRADSAEAFSRELINRWLTKQGSYGISRESVQTAPNPQSPPASRKSEEVGGWTEEDFIAQLVEDGTDEATARGKWKQAKSVGMLPYQMEGELPS